jgi:hypothetical protein
MKKIFNAKLAAVLLTVIIPVNIFTSDDDPLMAVKSPAVKQNYMERVASAFMFPFKKITEDFFLSPDFFADNHIVAYYGHPNSKIMGILGRYTKEELAGLVSETAGKYRSINGGKGVIPAFYVIYGTCQPKGEINRINRRLIESYIKYALANKMLIYLDHQIGKYTPQEAIRELIPFLKYPNVHLALDPEWRTTRPMKVIGSISGKEINAVQQIIQDYLTANNIPGKRQLVFHQFHAKMIRDREEVNANYSRVIPVHATSGWGRPEAKTGTHSRNSTAVNIPYKGFKLWYYYSSRQGVHYDRPLMTPEEVLALDPQPGLIIYQ